MNPSDLYSDTLDALTNSRSQMVSLQWQIELDAGTQAQRVLASNTLIQVQGAIVALSSAVLGEIADEMQENEVGLTQATADLNAALKDITKVQNVLNAVTSLTNVVGKIVPLL